MRRAKCPPSNKNASDKNDKLKDCDEKRELPIKVAFAQQCPVYCNLRRRQFVY